MSEQAWQDIRIAPRDGTQIVAVGRLRNGSSVIRACVTRWVVKGQPPTYSNEDGWIYSAPGYCDAFDATYWLPLPPPSGEAKSTE